MQRHFKQRHKQHYFTLFMYNNGFNFLLCLNNVFRFSQVEESNLKLYLSESTRSLVEFAKQMVRSLLNHLFLRFAPSYLKSLNKLSCTEISHENWIFQIRIGYVTARRVRKMFRLIIRYTVTNEVKIICRIVYIAQ